MELESIMQSEISQIYLLSHFYVECNKTKLTEIDIISVVARGREWGMNKLDKDDQKVQNPSYMINNFWGCNQYTTW